MRGIETTEESPLQSLRKVSKYIRGVASRSLTLRQMHTENGSSLSLDCELCITFHISAFYAISILRCGIYDISGKTALRPGSCVMEEPKYALCEYFRWRKTQLLTM